MKKKFATKNPSKTNVLENNKTIPVNLIKNVSKLTSYGKGRKGLSNLGNTCYLNTILQSLFTTTKLVEYFLKNNYRNDVNQSDGIAHEFYEIVKSFWEGDQQIISPLKLRSIIGNINMNFFTNDQQDSHEFLIFLLEALHTELNRVNILFKSYSFLTSLEFCLNLKKSTANYFE